MGVYSEYLDKAMSAPQLIAERKKMLKQISSIRKRDVLVYAADFSKAQSAPISISYDDIVPVRDQLDNLKGKAVDVILETPGGSGEVAEDIVRMLWEKFESVSFIVPGMAKSAGTIIVMSGDEILMDEDSSLGPIDAQVAFEGRQFSAEAFLTGFEKIKKESEETKSLNRAYIPILQRLSPGDLQHAENTLGFARTLVARWLSEHKFKNWTSHRTHNAGTPVTPEERQARADTIATELCNHSKWLVHGRSIKISDLRGLGLEITDYGEDPKLRDALKRFHVLLSMFFSGTNIYKLFETPESQILRFVNVGSVQTPVPPPGGGIPAEQAQGALADVNCPKCQRHYKIQMDFDRQQPLQEGTLRYPESDILVCTQCGNRMNLSGLRQTLEAQMKRKVAR